jgi:hypothetical protein
METAAAVIVGIVSGLGLVWLVNVLLDVAEKQLQLPFTCENCGLRVHVGQYAGQCSECHRSRCVFCLRDSCGRSFCQRCLRKTFHE